MAIELPEQARSYEVKGHQALDLYVPNIEMDEEEHSVRATISTEESDREDDILLAKGCNITNYEPNPIVLWEHGLSLDKPIGKSCDPDGNCTVTIGRGKVEAVCFFSKTLYEARQIYDLIGEKIVNATSVGWEPAEGAASARPGTGINRYRPGLLVKAWELLEWSFVGVPANPQALVKALARPRVAGADWSPLLRDSLKRYVPPPKRNQVQGWTPIKTERSMSHDKPAAIALDSTKYSKEAAAEWLEARNYKSELSIRDGAWFAKQFDELPEKTEEFTWKGEPHIKALMPAPPELEKPESTEPEAEAEPEVSTVDTPETPDEVTEPEAVDVPTEPLGQKVLTTIHASLGDFSQQLDAAATPLENPVVREVVGEAKSHIDAVLTKVSEAYADQYPSADALAEPVAGEPAELLAKFYAPLTKAGRDGAKGTQSWCQALAGNKALPIDVRRQAAAHAKSLGSVLEPVTRAGDQDKAVLEALADLKKNYQALDAQLKEVVPYVPED